MFVHSVFFWLHPATADDDAAFLRALHALLAIEHIQQGFIGPPAATRDDVIDHSYQYGLILLFADQAAQDAYQVDARHQAFIAAFQHRFAKVTVYDTEAACA